jgi:hypothetical protein
MVAAAGGVIVMPLEDWIRHSRHDMFLYDWQTLIAGVLALLAGIGTVWMTRHIANKQIKAAREEADRVIAATRDQTETTVRLERKRDANKSVAAASELQSAVDRCKSAILGKRKPEIWPTFTAAWDYHRRFRSTYEVAAMGRWESLSNPPSEVGKLLDRLREVGRSVDEGREPDGDELEKIAADLSTIVYDFRDRIAKSQPAA